MSRRPKRFPKFWDHNRGFEAVPAVVVADQTDKLGKRLAMLAFAVLLLFFSINGYIQSAKNGKSLKATEGRLSAAEKNQTELIKSLGQVTATLETQTSIVRQLRIVVQEQNNILRAAGLTPVDVPADEKSMPQVKPSPNPTSTPRVRITNEPDAKPRPKPSPKPSSKPKPPPPEPTPTPLVPVGKILCDTIGICLNP